MTSMTPAAPARRAAPVTLSPPVEPAPVLRDLLDRAVRRTAPLWPLENAVAVNPFLGRTDQDFAAAAHALSAVNGARGAPGRTLFAEALRSGRIENRHLARALSAARARDSAARLPRDAAELRARLLAGSGHEPTPRVPTVADVLGAHVGRDAAAFVTERVSVWAAAHFDRGQASWGSPWRHLSPFAAWRAELAHDRTPDVAGFAGLRTAIATLPDDPLAAATAVLARLGVPEAGLDVYLQRLAATVAGWMGYARYLAFQAELRDGRDDTALELLVIRLAWEFGLLASIHDPSAQRAWESARRTLVAPAGLLDAGDELRLDLLAHEAYELAWQDDLLERLGGPLASDAVTAAPARPAAQAVFCIDVRSEVFRRALEATGPDVATLGFAGFFGFPIEYVPLGDTAGGARCPALLTPGTVIAETPSGATQDQVLAATERRNVRRAAARAWSAFKGGAVSCFSFVGPVGLAYVGKLVSAAFPASRPVGSPDGAGVGPELSARVQSGRRTGMTSDERIDAAERVLRAMSLTRGFARVVLLAGHGSTSANNAHASGLDCGACGGHAGDVNARVAAAVFNDDAVRAGLRERGIDVPADTVFVPALHDTTTDDVCILDRDAVPATHHGDLARLEHRLERAGGAARRERAPQLGIDARSDIDAEIRRRARDGSQVRPEWGLAGCAAFIAAPRERTLGRHLAGRSFLHSYRWQDDADLSVLELILTAPMVVASWISLQYFGSAVDNRAFGCGDKTLHNVVSGVGVLEGNGGDLRTGLSWQSVHDGERLVHEPVRLHVIVEAPVEAITTVLERHPDVRRLIENRWVHLFAMDADGAVTQRYDRDLAWRAVD